MIYLSVSIHKAKYTSLAIARAGWRRPTSSFNICHVASVLWSVGMMWNCLHYRRLCVCRLISYSSRAVQLESWMQDYTMWGHSIHALTACAVVFPVPGVPTDCYNWDKAAIWLIASWIRVSDQTSIPYRSGAVQWTYCKQISELQVLWHFICSARILFFTYFSKNNTWIPCVGLLILSPVLRTCRYWVREYVVIAFLRSLQLLWISQLISAVWMGECVVSHVAYLSLVTCGELRSKRGRLDGVKNFSSFDPFAILIAYHRSSEMVWEW